MPGQPQVEPLGAVDELEPRPHPGDRGCLSALLVSKKMLSLYSCRTETDGVSLNSSAVSVGPSNDTCARTAQPPVHVSCSLSPFVECSEGREVVSFER